jgi:hypothetical protein
MFVLLALAALACVIATIINKLDERWSQLPHFIYNRIGGNWATCSITDFEKTAPETLTDEATGKTETFRCVKETIVFGNAATTEGTKMSYFSGSAKRFDLIPWSGEGIFHDAIQSKELFVPYCSERYGSFEQQADFFITPEIPEAFAQKKRRENRKADLRLRFIRFTKTWNTSRWQLWSMWALIVMAFFTLAAGLTIRSR